MNERNKKVSPETQPDYRYIVLAVHSWDTINAVTPMLVPVQPIGRSVGFALVYDSIEALRKDYPSATYCTIRPAGAKVRCDW